MPRTAFQVVYPDCTVMLDSGLDKATHDSFSPDKPEPYFPEHFVKLERALNAARLIVLTHHHADHVAGVVDRVEFRRAGGQDHHHDGRGRLPDEHAAPPAPQADAGGDREVHRARLSELLSGRARHGADQVARATAPTRRWSTSGCSPAARSCTASIPPGTWRMCCSSSGKAAPWVKEDVPAVHRPVALAQEGCTRTSANLTILITHDDDLFDPCDNERDCRRRTRDVTPSRQENGSRRWEDSACGLRRAGSSALALPLAAAHRRRAGAELSDASITVVVPFPAGGPSDVVARIVTEHDEQVARPVDGDRECRRRRRHDRQRARRGRGAGRLHAARRQHGLARRGAGADAERQIRFRARLRADRLHRACAGRDRRAQGLSGQGPARVRRLPEEERRQGEAGAWRHRLVVAHGVPAVRRGGRRYADAGRLSRHRAGDERSHRRPCRFLLRAGGERRSQINGGTIKAYRGCPRASGSRRCRTCRPRRSRGSTTR